MTWNRKFWGVEFRGSIDSDPPMLIGSGWLSYRKDFYPGEPTRALLFCTRSQARDFCRVKNAENRARNDLCSKWRFTPVRVRELVTKDN